ncbi:MAG: hypothetical protein JWN57_2433 [Frankiales bacterium]|nr:hypothetical protein [Frankiales bacterium]
MSASRHDRHPLGVPAAELSDAELERELAITHERRHETFLRGTAHALSTHTRRMFELELEYLARFPDRVSDDAQKLSGER